MESHYLQRKLVQRTATDKDRIKGSRQRGGLRSSPLLPQKGCGTQAERAIRTAARRRHSPQVMKLRTKLRKSPVGKEDWGANFFPSVQKAKQADFKKEENRVEQIFQNVKETTTNNYMPIKWTTWEKRTNS